MTKTTIFNKDVKPKEFGIDFDKKFLRSKRDSLLSQSLGYELSEDSDLTYLSLYLTDLSKIHFPDRVRYIAVWDFETTDRFNSYGVSLAIVLYDLIEETIVDKFYELMNPLKLITKDAQKVHGISQEEVNSEKTFEEHLPQIEAIFNKSDMFVGHNLAFDLAVLEREYQRLNLTNLFTDKPVFDTMKAAKRVLNLKDKNGKKLKDPKLIECVEFYGLDSEQTFHNALIDVQETLNVFNCLMEEEVS